MKRIGLMLIELKVNVNTVFTNTSKVVLILLKFHIDRYFIFRHVRKIVKSDCDLCHVHPCTRMEQLDSHWTDFCEIRYLSFFANLSRKFRFY